MGVQEEQERRSELLQRSLEAYSDPEQALAMALRMDQFIIDGQTSREQPREATQTVVQPSSEGPRKTCNRPRWTAVDDTHLRRLWQDSLTVEEIAQELQRTPASIYARVRILDLSPNKRAMKSGRRKVELPGPDKCSPTVISKARNGIEAAAPKIDGPHKSKH